MTTSAEGVKLATTCQVPSFEAERCPVPQRDKELVQAVWDESAAELSRLALAMGLDPGRVEDVLQDVYLAAWQKSPRGVDRADLRRWLFKVTANRCNLEHRRQRRWRAAVSTFARLWSDPSKDHDAAGAASRSEERELVRRALDSLEPQLRTVLVLRYFSELDSKEISRVLGIPDSTVRSQLSSARRRLALKLKQAGYADDEAQL